MMIGEKLVGTWKLISVCAIRESDGEVKYPFSKQPVGQLMYDSIGNMSVVIIRPKSSGSSANDDSQSTAGKKSNSDGFQAYFGVYEIDEEKRIVVHHIKGSSFPDWEGTAQTRFVEISENQLTLKTPAIPYSGEMFIWKLVWERKS